MTKISCVVCRVTSALEPSSSYWKYWYNNNKSKPFFHDHSKFCCGPVWELVLETNAFSFCQLRNSRLDLEAASVVIERKKWTFIEIIVTFGTLHIGFRLWISLKKYIFILVLFCFAFYLLMKKCKLDKNLLDYFVTLWCDTTRLINKED